MKNKRSCVGVCATCPWRVSNWGKPHPAGWYKKSNLIRLWNGIRTGKAPGMICHSTDPASVEYGSTKQVPGTAIRRECGGALILVFRHINVLNGCLSFAEYKDKVKRPMTKAAIAGWVSRKVFGPLAGGEVPEVTFDEDAEREIGVPE